MTVTLCTGRIRTLDIRAFLGGPRRRRPPPQDREAAHAFIERTPVRFRYHLGLTRGGKGLVGKFLPKVTGYSISQLARLIAQQHRTGRIRDHRKHPPAWLFPTVHTAADTILLTEVDEAFGQLSGLQGRDHGGVADRRGPRPRLVSSHALLAWGAADSQCLEVGGCRPGQPLTSP